MYKQPPMKIFTCPSCNHVLYFENFNCLNCGTQVGFNPENCAFEAIDFNHCYNRDISGCNWLAAQGNSLCTSCNLTRHKPDKSYVDHFEKLKLLEAAKRRLIYQILQLELPLISKKDNYVMGLEFDFLTENNPTGALTGHQNGTITILLSEADVVHREKIKKEMSEPYRTLLGHFRHEIGHYYWNMFFLNKDQSALINTFGDHNQDYSTALQNYYSNGAPPQWNTMFISPYASSHPWEDWAETWAHYLHLMDTTETASYLGLSLQSSVGANTTLNLVNCPNPYLSKDFDTLYKAGVSLTNAVNSLNRSMGIADIYPFVIPNSVYKKLSFIHHQILSET